jgi:hypothetical protein
VLQQYLGEQLVARSGSLRPGGWALTPFIEGPDAVRLAVGTQTPEDSGRREGFGGWVRGHLTRTPSMASAATYFAKVLFFVDELGWNDYGVMLVAGTSVLTYLQLSD